MTDSGQTSNKKHNLERNSHDEYSDPEGSCRFSALAHRPAGRLSVRKGKTGIWQMQDNPARQDMRCCRTSVRPQEERADQKNRKKVDLMEKKRYKTLNKYSRQTQTHPAIAGKVTGRHFNKNGTNPKSYKETAMNQMKCPKCGNIAYTKNTGRKVGTVIGATVGGTSAATGTAAVGAVVGTAAVGTAAVGTAAVGTATGLKVGALAGTCLGPVGLVAGAGIGAILGFLAGIGRGASNGYKVGKLIDEKVIGEYACPHCGHTFTQ